MDDGEAGNTVQASDSRVDSLMGRYQNEDEMRMGDRSIDELIEIKEKNN